MARPVIAVTGPERGAIGPRTCVALAVRLYGGRPLHLRPSAIEASATGPRAPAPGGPGPDAPLAAAGPPGGWHGVVVTGGHDIDPVLYAAEPEVEPRHDPGRDRLETAVINDALTRGLPLLGICRGAQLLNVCRGGSLFQDLRSRRRKTSNRRTVLPLKTLCVEPATLLHAHIGAATAGINSLHNQGIDRLGAGLAVSGRDLDGIVQAVEDPALPFLIGVQWHPEFLLFLARQRRLFRSLVAEARAVMATAGPDEVSGDGA